MHPEVTLFGLILFLATIFAQTKITDNTGLSHHVMCMCASVFVYHCQLLFFNGFGLLFI